MKRYMTLLMFLLACACANAAQAAGPSDEAAIRGVVESFNRAVANRDKPKYMALFLHGNVSWQSVMDDGPLERERRKNPLATRAGVDPGNTYLTFIDNIVNNPKVSGAPAVPDFPITIESDGDVASTSQDYEYYFDGRIVGRGRAFWLLVRTEEGWKITAVAYSKRSPQPVK